MSPALEILTLAQARLREEIAWPDVYFDPGYGAAVQVSDGARWEVAIGAGGRIVSPYLLRPVDPELTDGAALFDTVSPYGYAGTWVAPDVDVATVRAWRAELKQGLRERGVVAEFQRLSGLVPGRDALLEADPSVDAHRHADTIDVPFAEGYDAYWAGAHGRHRTSVRKAHKTGHTWSEGPAPLDALLEGGWFRTLYDGTMERVSAKEYYFFTDPYYEALVDALGDRLRLGRVVDEHGEPAGGALFFVWGDRLHYHLAGSLKLAGRKGVSNLLLDRQIQWGIEQGLRALHLGGGLSEDDALFKFKAQFGGERVPYWLLKGVVDDERYGRLVARRAAATGRSTEELLASGFFPAYRA